VLLALEDGDIELVHGATKERTLTAEPRLENSERCAAFSDGVFSIAATLLILEIRLPHPGSHGGLWADLVALWPSYLAFVLSFFVIVGVWMNQSGLIRMVRGVNRRFLLANSMMLLYVTYLPFPTHVLASHLDGPDRNHAVAFYCSAFILGNIASILILESMVRDNLLGPEVDARIVRGIRIAIWVGFMVNVCATLVALVLPWLALMLTFSVRLWYLRLRFRNPSIMLAQGTDLHR
jgi:uncharacterized membrane protein